MSFQYLDEVVEASPSKIVLLVADGLGGLPDPDTGKSELETAHTPNLDALAAESALGLTDPVYPGITPGSGPGHLALFGYDPLSYLIKRGIMEALGIGLDVQPGEIAVRGNFCTLDETGNVADRRAGRIPSEESQPLVDILDRITIDGTKVRAYPVKDHRFVLVFSGDGLDDQVTESDPQKAGLPPMEIRPLSPVAEKMARIANEFAADAREALAGRNRANMVLLRGFSQPPEVPSMSERFLLNPAAIATYPMYRGLSRIVGMKILQTGTTIVDEMATLAEHRDDHDFFFVHFKPADAAGEDGDFSKKVQALEEFDTGIPALREVDPDVIMIAGDHSTPSILSAHSWHPVPYLLHSRYSGADGVAAFNERACARGSLGRFPAEQTLMLGMANALKLKKFGA